MNRLAVLSLFALAACGDGRPMEWETCATENELRCGVTRAGGTAALLCQPTGSWATVGATYGEACASSCSETGTNMVTCSGTTYARPESPCDDMAKACSLYSGDVLSCRAGVWSINTECPGDQKCGAGPDGAPSCI